MEIGDPGAGALDAAVRHHQSVLFHSNLFHTSDNVRFEAGYENRRMNITMLFGKRGAGTCNPSVDSPWGAADTLRLFADRRV